MSESVAGKVRMRFTFNDDGTMDAEVSEVSGHGVSRECPSCHGPCLEHNEATPFEGLTPPYSTIVADPPWRYASAATKADAAKRYSTMDLHDILALPVDLIAAPDCHLWLWCTNALMEDGYRVVRAWGFRPLTVVTWCKQAPGVGHYLRNNTEHCILASRGKPMVPEHKPLATWYQWDRGAHSAKPAAFFDLVQQVSPPPYIELFSRAPQLGWESWGKGFEEVAS